MQHDAACLKFVGCVLKAINPKDGLLVENDLALVALLVVVRQNDGRNTGLTGRN